MEMLIYNLSFLENFSKGIEGKKIKKFLYLSSDAVYHDTKKQISETTPANPTSLHGYMHLLRENYFKDYFNDKLCILRPTLIYGDKDPHNGYGPNKFIRDIKRNNNISYMAKVKKKEIIFLLVMLQKLFQNYASTILMKHSILLQENL